MNPAGRVLNWESEYARFFSSFLPIITKGLVLKGVRVPLVIKTRIKTLLTVLKISNRIVKFIRCDNAGKNMTMKNDPEIKSFGINFEFFGPRNPQ
jgi:hypothetical protein